MKRPTVSVIVPVYNAEKTLRRCLDSIRSQTWREIEVLLVDDGSTDASAAICREGMEDDFHGRRSIYKLIQSGLLSPKSERTHPREG